MITEDYVSFETAKLLKEKGFDERTNMPHIDDYQRLVCYIPTLQMAMKWLREVHNIHISINTVCDGKVWGYEAIIQKQRIPVPAALFIDWKDTSEEACEEAIKYCLETLI